MPEEIVDGVYDLTCGRLGGMRFRAYLVAEPVPTLVDTTYERLADNLIAELESLGTAPDRVVVTHDDPDHTGALDAVVDRYDPEPWLPEETGLTTGGGAERRYGHGDAVGPFEAVHVPGHSPDAYALVDTARGIAVTGDTVIGADWRGLPPGYLLPPPGRLSDDVHAAEANLDRLLAYDFEVALVSHGTAVTDGAAETLARFVNFPLPDGTKERLGLDY